PMNKMMWIVSLLMIIVASSCNDYIASDYPFYAGVRGSGYSRRIQLGASGFPLDIGNKWYFRYVNFRSQSEYILVQTIIDTTTDGVRIVQITKLHDTVTLG